MTEQRILMTPAYGHVAALAASAHELSQKVAGLAERRREFAYFYRVRFRIQAQTFP